MISSNSVNSKQSYGKRRLRRFKKNNHRKIFITSSEDNIEDSLFSIQNRSTRLLRRNLHKADNIIIEEKKRTLPLLRRDLKNEKNFIDIDSSGIYSSALNSQKNNIDVPRGKLRVLRRNLIRSISSGSEEKEKYPKISDRNSSKNTSIDSDFKNHTDKYNSSLLSDKRKRKGEEVPQNTKIKLRSDYKKEKSLSRVLVSSEDEQSFINDNKWIGIDKTFENSLYYFSDLWLKNCSIYEGTEVYINSESYANFMQLEPRISYDKKVPSSGFYIVSKLKCQYIGQIPYLYVSLDRGKYVIQFYEYPDSEGIICTKDQYDVKEGENVLICAFNSFIEGKVTSSSDMRVYINKTWYLKSMIAIPYKPLDIDQISISQHNAKPLFGIDRSGKNHLNTPMNYSYINFKIKNHLYRRRSDLVWDLKAVWMASKDLGDPYERIAYQVFRNYK